MSSKAEDQEAAEPADGVGLRAQGTATYTAALSMMLLPRKKAWSFQSSALGHTHS